MQWDLGWQGVALLAVMSLGFGVAAGLLVGGALSGRVRATAIAAVACFAIGLFTSEGLFGWATEEELQPNIDGLSRDEVLLSSVLTMTAVVIVMRWFARRRGRRATTGPGARDLRH